MVSMVSNACAITAVATEIKIIPNNVITVIMALQF